MRRMGEFANPKGENRTEVLSTQTSRPPERRTGNLMADDDDCFTDRKPTFPEILMEILNDEANQDILRWMPCGMQFTITNYRKFVEEHMDRIFHIRHMSSFVRKLNRWGFIRELVDGNLDIFEHPCFRRDQPELCRSMRNVIEDRPKRRKPRESKDLNSSSCGKSSEEKYSNKEVSDITPIALTEIASSTKIVNQISPTSMAPYSGIKTGSRVHREQNSYQHHQQLHHEYCSNSEISPVFSPYHRHRVSPRVVEMSFCPRQYASAPATIQQYQQQQAAHLDDANHFDREDIAYNYYQPSHQEYNRQHE